MFGGNRQERKQSKNYECESSRKKQRKDLRATQGIFFTSQRKAEALEGKRYNYRRSLIQGGRGAHLLYLQKFCATLFSKKSFKRGRDSLQSILKPLFAIFQDPHAVLVSGFTRTQPATKSISPRSSPMGTFRTKRPQRRRARRNGCFRRLPTQQCPQS